MAFILTEQDLGIVEDNLITLNNVLIENFNNELKKIQDLNNQEKVGKLRQKILDEWAAAIAEGIGNRSRQQAKADKLTPHIALIDQYKKHLVVQLDALQRISQEASPMKIVNIARDAIQKSVSETSVDNIVATASRRLKELSAPEAVKLVQEAERSRKYEMAIDQAVYESSVAPIVIEGIFKHSMERETSLPVVQSVMHAAQKKIKEVVPHSPAATRVVEAFKTRLEKNFSAKPGEDYFQAYEMRLSLFNSNEEVMNFFKKHLPAVSKDKDMMNALASLTQIRLFELANQDPENKDFQKYHNQIRIQVLHRGHIEKFKDDIAKVSGDEGELEVMERTYIKTIQELKSLLLDEEFKIIITEIKKIFITACLDKYSVLWNQAILDFSRMDFNDLRECSGGLIEKIEKMFRKDKALNKDVSLTDKFLKLRIEFKILKLKLFIAEDKDNNGKEITDEMRLKKYRKTNDYIGSKIKNNDALCEEYKKKAERVFQIEENHRLVDSLLTEFEAGIKSVESAQAVDLYFSEFTLKLSKFIDVDGEFYQEKMVLAMDIVEKRKKILSRTDLNTEIMVSMIKIFKAEIKASNSPKEINTLLDRYSSALPNLKKKDEKLYGKYIDVLKRIVGRKVISLSSSPKTVDKKPVQKDQGKLSENPHSMLRRAHSVLGQPSPKSSPVLTRRGSV
jgi:hypothetical protein